MDLPTLACMTAHSMRFQPNTRTLHIRSLCEPVFQRVGSACAGHESRVHDWHCASPQINRGYRVQFSSAIGPYKGGLRFHPTVSTC
jgi:glutamate dehydrogenase/leucine dehydrogenase